MHRPSFQLFAALGLVGLVPALATAQIAVTASITSEEAAKASQPNTAFQVTLDASNIGSDPITAFDIRVDYDRSKVELTNVAFDSWAGSTAVTPALGSTPSGSLPAAWRHLSGADLSGDLAAGITGSTRTLATLTFTTTASPVGPYTISFGTNNRGPNRDQNPMLVIQNNASRAVSDAGTTTINSAATTNFGAGLTDADGDGVADALEPTTRTPAAGVSNGFLRDSDGDGLLDNDELNYDRSAALLFNYTRDAATEPNPRFWDSDGDGYADGLEVRYPAIFPNGPLVADAPANADADGLPDALDPNPAVAATDSDGDRVRDSYELAFGITLANLATQTPPIAELNNVSPVNAGDASLLAQWTRRASAADPGPANLTQRSNADLRADGTVNAGDASLLAQRARNLVVSLPNYPTAP